MPVTGCKIGSTQPGLQYVEYIVSQPPCKCAFTRHPVLYQAIDGSTVGDGLPIARWTFKFLSQTEVNALRSYVHDGSTYLTSKAVYITTRLDDGSYATFSAVMHWDADKVEESRTLGDNFRDVEITFTHLEYVT